ncbi:FAD dependent oxidoreductase [alpha proteobacterium BAL199]|jgi:cation diffusion facilitator CzcD-associated flavoprotein CzcO|nr:FAD dependent oxidoreductase [alpha proteobacterium BAL199]
MADSDVDAVIVGAGFAGLYMLHRLRGLGFSAQVVEAGGGVGGTWYWNRYPGARCDVESIQYSYQFSDELQQEWEWSERYAAQPEILRYAEHVAERFDLHRDIRFDTRVTLAAFDDSARRWVIDTEVGDRLRATWCIMATGCLSASNIPNFEGRDSFTGATYHTGHWPHEGVDFSGQRVGVIGTGSSAIQSIPIIAEQAEHLTVFQRTPNYAIPAHNAPWDPEVLRQAKANYPEMRARARRMPNGIAFRLNTQSALEATPEERRREYEARWREGGLTFLGAYGDLILNAEANATAAEFVRGKIREIVQDPEIAETLLPSNVIGCKRLCVDTDYYKTFNRRNVTLVDLNKAPIEAITPDGVRAGGVEHGFDAIVFATGFDAMTGALLKIDIRGVGGVPLREKWDSGPRTYLGLATAGFPNLFMVTGPGSPSVLTNMLPSIEQHVDWIADCLAHMRANGIARVEARTDAEDDWVAHVNEVAGFSLRSTCSSWYVGANVPGKPRVFMPYIGGFPAYVDRCDAVAANGYEGFALSA